MSLGLEKINKQLDDLKITLDNINTSLEKNYKTIEKYTVYGICIIYLYSISKIFINELKYKGNNNEKNN